MGRKAIVFNRDQIEQVEKLGPYLSIEQVAEYFGICKKSFYELMARQPEIATRYKKGRSEAIATVAKGLLQKAREGDFKSMCFYLKTQAGWRETNAVDLQSSDGSMSPPSTVKVVFEDPEDKKKTTKKATAKKATKSKTTKKTSTKTAKKKD
jgi:hypothetical protein